MTAGFLSSFYTKLSLNTWYKTLAKPWFIPPRWFFSSAWIVLFILMGISLFIISEHKTTYEKSKALLVFDVQWVAHICWPIAFFVLCSPLAGLIGILILLSLIMLTIYLFYDLSKTAAFLLIPHALWAGFATLVSASIYYLN
jgi:tryptophan-rich sensory protein